MSSSGATRLIQVISYAMNQYSGIPLLSRMHLYDTMHKYLLSQENKMLILEDKVSKLEMKVASLERENKLKGEKNIII